MLGAEVCLLVVLRCGMNPLGAFSTTPAFGTVTGGRGDAWSITTGHVEACEYRDEERAIGQQRQDARLT